MSTPTKELEISGYIHTGKMNYDFGQRDNRSSMSKKDTVRSFRHSERQRMKHSIQKEMDDFLDEQDEIQKEQQKLSDEIMADLESLHSSFDDFLFEESMEKEWNRDYQYEPYYDPIDYDPVDFMM